MIKRVSEEDRHRILSGAHRDISAEDIKAAGAKATSKVMMKLMDSQPEIATMILPTAAEITAGIIMELFRKEIQKELEG